MWAYYSLLSNLLTAFLAKFCFLNRNVFHCVPPICFITCPYVRCFLKLACYRSHYNTFGWCCQPIWINIFLFFFDIIYANGNYLGEVIDILRKINKMRLDRNWSIYRLSVESEVPQSTLTNMFNRETLPSITTLSSICKAFNISLSEFFLKKQHSMKTSPLTKNLLRCLIQ